MKRPARTAVEAAVRTLIAHAGDDPARPGLAETPSRVVDAFTTAFSGYGRDPRAALGAPLPAGRAAGQLVVLRDLPFLSYCEHHLAPFFGTATVAFEAAELLVGIGHLADLVTVLARRLQLQERLTEEIADVLARVLAPRGIAVLLDATHTCLHLHHPRAGPGRLRTLHLSGSLRERAASFPALFGGDAGAAQSGSV